MYLHASRRVTSRTAPGTSGWSDDNPAITTTDIVHLAIRMHLQLGLAILRYLCDCVAVMRLHNASHAIFHVSNAAMSSTQRITWQIKRRRTLNTDRRSSAHLQTGYTTSLKRQIASSLDQPAKWGCLKLQANVPEACPHVTLHFPQISSIADHWVDMRSRSFDSVRRPSSSCGPAAVIG